MANAPKPAEPDNAEELGRAKERADVLRFLRSGHWTASGAQCARFIASAIERLDHHKGEGENAGMGSHEEP